MNKALPLFLALITGCGGAQRLPVLHASLEGAKTVSQAARTAALAESNVVGCYVVSASITALGTAQDAVQGWMMGMGAGVIPSVDVDISGCQVLSRKLSAGPVAASLVSLGIQLIQGAVVKLLEARDAECEAIAVTVAVFRYLDGVHAAVASEVSDPDGRISIPSVKIGECK